MEFRVVASGLGFTEGPVLTRGGEIAVTSVDRGEIHAVTPAGTVRLMADVGGGPNGLAEGTDGTLYVAQNGGHTPSGRRPGFTGGLQAVRPGGSVEWITMDPISSNDLCFGPDGLLYLTDPTFRLSAAAPDGRLWRVDADVGEPELLASVPWFPNGIGFGLDDGALYVASSLDSRIVRFAIDAAGLGVEETFVRMDRGVPDGFAFDRDGNLLVATVSFDGNPGTIQVWDRDGRFVDHLRPGGGKLYTNIALSEDGRLYVTDAANGALLVAEGYPTPGLPLHPFR